MRSRSTAFTLVEVLIAVTTLCISLMLVVALGISVLRRNNHALDIPAGSIAAENILNQLIYGANNDIPAGTHATFFSASTSGIAWTSGSYAMNRIDFAYATDLSNVGVGTSTGMATNRLIKVHIDVTWTGGDQNNGLQKCDLTRLIHENI